MHKYIYCFIKKPKAIVNYRYVFFLEPHQVQLCGKKPAQAFDQGCLGDAAELWQLFSMPRSSLTSLFPWAWGTGKTSQETTNGARPCFKSTVLRFEWASLWGTAFHSLCFPGTAAPASHLWCLRKATLRDQEIEILSCSLDYSSCDSPLCQPLLSRLRFRSHLLHFCQTPTSVQP